MERFFRLKLDHVVFWLATIIFHMFTRVHLVDKAGFAQFFIEIIVRNGLLAAVIYVNLLVLIPRLIASKKSVGYIFSLAAVLMAYALLKNVHDVYLNGYVLDDADKRDFFYNTFYNLSIVLFYTAFSVALYLSREWYQQRELIRKIEVEKLNTELAYLKSQINPHFLFNSINTIYFQIEKKNTVARETLSKFSEMLRYQLYECNGHEVAVEREVAYLRNYVDLQRLRKDENYEITFNCGNEVKGFTIAPLLLICFIENAFKHVSHYPSGNKVSISLERRDSIFRVNVLNTTDQKTGQPEHEGIGLKNVKRRLALLYGTRHALDIRDADGCFEIDLQITLS